MKFRINCILTLIFLFFGSSLERSNGNHGISPIKFDNSPQKWTHRDLLLFANNGGFSGDLPPQKSSTVSPLSFITSQVGNMIEYAYNCSFGALYSFMEPAIYHIKKTPTITRLFMIASIIPTIASWLSYNGYFPSFLLFQGWRDFRVGISRVFLIRFPVQSACVTFFDVSTYCLKSYLTIKLLFFLICIKIFEPKVQFYTPLKITNGL